MSVIGLMLATLAMYSVRTQICGPYLKFPQHTMCIYKEATCQPQLKLIKRGLTDSQKAEVVAIHNQLRQDVAQGRVTGAPPAESMPNVQYMEELAVIAQRAADQCLFQHDKERRVAQFKVGQNIFMTKRRPFETNTNPNMTAASIAWFNEIFSPGFHKSNISPFKSVSGSEHYTQMVWADTLFIGCGYTMFIDGLYSKKLVFCNYGPGGNIIGETMYKVKKTLSAMGANSARKPLRKRKPRFHK